MSKKFIAFIFGLFILVGAVFFFTLHWGSQLPTPQTPAANNANAPAVATVPKTPSVTLTVQKSKNGNMLLVQWENLPDNTTALDIFRSAKGKNNWSLWKTITIGPGDLAGGSAKINIGNSTFVSYSFYIEAVNGNGNGSGSGSSTGSGTNGAGQPILWISSSTDATVTTLTSNQSGSGNIPPNNEHQNSSSTKTNNNSTPTSTTPAQNSGGSPPPPPGTPYYTPQMQISGYGSDQSGIFWVQHVDQKIQIGWQSLPPQTTNIAIFRSPNQDGPWTSVLTQENPGVNGSYSLQLVDDTLGQPYYYEMTALAESSTIATYGPVYLPPVGQ